MEVKRFFVVAKKVPDIHSCQVVIPQNLKLSDLQASQPNQSCVANIHLCPVLHGALKTWLCLWSLLTEEDREHLNSHWCGKVGKGQQIPAGLPRFYFLSPWSIFSIIKEVIEANSLKDLDFQSPVQQVFPETSHFWKFNLVLTIGHL